MIIQQKMPKKIRLYSNSYKGTILLFCPEQLKSKDNYFIKILFAPLVFEKIK
jgi:hypothetical protein